MSCTKFIPAGLIFTLVLFSTFLCGQHPVPPKTIKAYFHWGYNRAVYHTSNIHYSGGNDFDFTVHDVVATDCPDKFSEDYLNPVKFTIPQFSFRVGVLINDKWSISGGWDHLKYRIKNGQTVKISGFISENSGGKYAGNYDN